MIWWQMQRISYLSEIRPLLGPCVLKETVTGPGCSSLKYQVQFRAAEKICLKKIDYYLHIHKFKSYVGLPKHVERTHMAVGEARSVNPLTYIILQ